MRQNKKEEQLNKKNKKNSKDSIQVALGTECISENVCQTEDVAVNHCSLGESAFTDLPFFTSEVLTSFTTINKTSSDNMHNLTLYRNPGAEGYFYVLKKMHVSNEREYKAVCLPTDNNANTPP